MNNEPVGYVYSVAGEPIKSAKIASDIPNGTPLYTHPVKEQEIEKLIGNLRNVAEAQSQKGCWDYDQYMLGLFNGLELALSIFEKREPQFRELTSHPVKELTDEEILKQLETVIGSEKFEFSNDPMWIKFARAILRKAQEK